MPIGPITMLAIYLVVWWVVLFVVLPLGMDQGSRDKPADGGDWGAPAAPNLKKKAITTTWLAAIVWAVIMLILWTGVIDLDWFSPGG